MSLLILLPTYKQRHFFDAPPLNKRLSTDFKAPRIFVQAD